MSVSRITDKFQSAKLAAAACLFEAASLASLAGGI